MTRAFLAFTLILFFIAPGYSRISPPPVVEGGPVSPFQHLRFEENRGQADPRVRFAGRAGGYQAYLTDSGLELHSGPAAVRMRFEGAGEPQFHPADRVASYSYYLGNDPKKWVPETPVYSTVAWRGLYPGVDAIFRGQGRQLKYDLIVNPGADPRQIRLRLDGADQVDEDNGVLTIRAGGRSFRQSIPAIYQEIDGTRVSVRGGFQRRADGTWGLAVGSYDRGLPLTVDPLIESGYYGGDGNDKLVTYTPQFIAGTTSSLSLGTYGRTQKGRSIFVFMDALFEVPPSRMMFLGGSDDDDLAAAAPPPQPRLDFVLVGTTASRDFPGALNRHSGGLDGFLMRITPASPTVGPARFATTYIGGSDDDVITSAVIPGDAYFAGYTTSKDLPTVAPVQAQNNGGEDAFFGVTVFNSIRFLTYWGGSGNDRALAVASGGGIWVGGETKSNDLVLPDGPTPIRGPSDAFLVASISPTLTIAKTFGGSGEDRIQALTVAMFGVGPRVSAAGTTTSPDLPLTGGTLFAGGTDAFFARIEWSDGSFQRAAYFGGAGQDSAVAIYQNDMGHVYLAGSTRSSDLPVRNALQPRLNGAEDAFLALFDADNRLLQATYFGGSGVERATGLSLVSDQVQMIGETNSADLPLERPLNRTFEGGFDGFYAVLRSNAILMPAEIVLGKDLTKALPIRFDDIRRAPTTVRSLNPSKVRVNDGHGASAEVTIPVMPDTSVLLEALEDSGEAEVLVSTPGFEAATVRVRLYPTVITAEQPQFTPGRSFGPTIVATLAAFDPQANRTVGSSGFGVPRPGLPDHRVTWSSSDSSVVSVERFQTDGAAFLQLGRAGVAILRYSSNLFPSWPAELEVNVPRLDIQIPDTAVGLRAQVLLPVRLANFRFWRSPIVFRSSEPTRLLLSLQVGAPGVPEITVNPNPSLSTISLWVRGLSDSGTATLTASSPDFGEVAATVRLTPSRLSLAHQTLLITGVRPPEVRVAGGETFILNPGLLSIEGVLTGSDSRVGPDTNFGMGRLISSNPNVVSVPQEPVELPRGDRFVTYQAVAVSEGTAELRLEAASGSPVLPSEPLRVIVGPASERPLIEAVSDLYVGNRLQHLVAWKVNDAAREVTVTSENPALVTLALFADQPGQPQVASSLFYLRGLAAAGDTRLRVTSPGFATQFVPVHLVPSGLAFSKGDYNLTPLTPAPSPIRVAAFALDPATLAPWIEQTLSPGLTAQIRVESSNPAIQPASQATVVGQPLAVPTSLPGTTTLTLGPQPEGFREPSKRTRTLVTVAENAVRTSTILLAKDMTVNMFVSSSNSLQSAWTITSGDPSRLLVSFEYGEPQPTVSGTGSTFNPISLTALDDTGSAKAVLTRTDAETQEIEVHFAPLSAGITAAFGSEMTAGGSVGTGRLAIGLASAGSIRFGGSLRRGVSKRFTLHSSNPEVVEVPPFVELAQFDPGYKDFPLKPGKPGDVEITMPGPEGIRILDRPLRVRVVPASQQSLPAARLGATID